MKIAILTQPLCNNYGGTLQNFALQTVLRRLGYEVVTLNTPIPTVRYSTIRLLLSCCKRLLRKYIYKDPSIVYVNPLKQHNKLIENSKEHKRFIETYINSIMVDLPLTSEFCQSHQFDAYVVGSDQVWRPRYNRHLQNFYLDFTSDVDVRRIAYAASFGVDSWEAEEQITTQIKALAQQFDAISVREESGVDLCRNYLGVEAQWVLDPTMLLDAETYLKYAGKATTQEKERYIGVYMLDMTKEKVAAVEQLAKQMSLPIRYIGRMTCSEYPSIESWLQDIDNAEYVVTDSFHGTVFSIIFHKKFLSIGNQARGNSRFFSLLSMFGQQCRLVPLEQLSKERMESNIDYDTVSEILSIERNKAMNFLNKALG